MLDEYGPIGIEDRTGAFDTNEFPARPKLNGFVVNVAGFRPALAFWVNGSEGVEPFSGDIHVNDFGTVKTQRRTELAIEIDFRPGFADSRYKVRRLPARHDSRDVFVHVVEEFG